MMMNIRKLLLAAAVLPAMVMGAEVSDTTITVNDQKIVIAQRNGQTTVKVYQNDGQALSKVSETQFVDSQEVERVYITSPFIPQFNKRSGKRRLMAHYPFFFFGNSQLSGSVAHMGGNSAMHSRDSKSWEWGLSLSSLCFPLSNSLAVTSTLQVGQVHHHFQDNYVMGTHDTQTAMIRKGGETLRMSYISYNLLRIPLMMEWQRRIGHDDFFLAAGPSVEWRWNEYSRYFIGKSKFTETNDINLNPIGVNFEMHIGYGSLMLYGRTALTSLLTTDRAPKCYPVSIGIGLML